MNAIQKLLSKKIKWSKTGLIVFYAVFISLGTFLGIFTTVGIKPLLQMNKTAWLAACVALAAVAFVVIVAIVMRTVIDRNDPDRKI